MSQFSIKPITTTRRTKSGSAIMAILSLPEKHAAEQLPKELALELTGQPVAFAIVNRGNKEAAKGDLTAATITPDSIKVMVSEALAEALAELKKK